MSLTSSSSAIGDPLRRRQILVVDDTRVAAHTLARLLQALGQNVRVASNGAEALQMLETAVPDVMISDIGMPNMDGYELARRIRAEGAYDGLILVALTGYGQDEDRRRALLAGFRDHLTKPVSVQALQALLTSLDDVPRDRSPGPAAPS